MFWYNGLLISFIIAFQPSSRQVFSQRLVESKRCGRSLVAIILGMSVSQAIKYKLIDGSLLRTNDPLADSAMKSDDDGGLFVSEDEGDEQGQLSTPEIPVTDTTTQRPAVSSPFGTTSNDKAPNIFGQPTVKPPFGGNSAFGLPSQALSPTASLFVPQTSNASLKVCKCLFWFSLPFFRRIVCVSNQWFTLRVGKTDY